VHALQYGGDAALVSTDEFGDVVDGGGLQCRGGVAAAAAVSVWGTFTAIPRMDVV